MLKELFIQAIGSKDGRRGCSIPTRCPTSDDRSFDQIMASEWEELVIKFDQRKNDFVIKTACCPGAPAC